MSRESHFDQLLHVAAAQADPQRLLFVFARADLPDRPTPAQRSQFHAGQGGTLTPLMCVDTAPKDLANFDTLVAEARRAGPPWQVVFAAALSGEGGQPPKAAQVGPALEKMVNAIWAGSVGQFAAFDAAGDPVRIS